MAKVWVFVLDDAGVTGVEDFAGNPVQAPQVHKFYQADDTNLDVGSTDQHKLYHADNDKIDAYDLSRAATAYWLVHPASLNLSNDDPLAPLEASMFQGLQEALVYLDDPTDDDFDLTEKILEIAADVKAGMDNATLKSKHGIKAPEANAIRKIVTT